MKWNIFDYVVMAALLISAGTAFYVSKTRMTSSRHRAVLAVLLIFVMLLIWTELAVGIFGSPFAGN